MAETWVNLDITYSNDMKTNPLQNEIAKPTSDLERIAQKISGTPGLLPDVLAGLRADTARIKYRCLKVLLILSEKQPAILYPDFDFFANLMDCDNNILKWGAIIIIGNLAVVDSGNKIDALLDRYLQPIPGPVMITAANTIGGAGRIGLAKPYLVEKIVPALLQTEKAKYQTPECRNVALGHVLKSLDLVFDHIRNPQPVLALATRQLRNSRNAVQVKARAFLKKHSSNN
jgi:hypothetical protein